MQNDFAAKGGVFDRAGIDITGIRKAIQPMRKVLHEASLLTVQTLLGWVLDSKQFLSACA